MAFKENREIFHNERWPSNIRLPAWEDFKDGRIPIYKPAFNDVVSCLEEKQVALLLGPASRGKSFLTYSISFHMIDPSKMTSG